MSDSGQPVRVLLVEDSEADAELVLRHLKKGGFRPFWERVETREAFEKALTGGPWDLVLCDNSMPHFSGAEAQQLLHRLRPELPFVFFSGVRPRASAGGPIPRSTAVLEKGEWTQLLSIVRTIAAGQAAPQEVQPRPQGAVPAVTLAPVRPRLLLVDDRAENLAALESALAGVDAELDRAASGQEALARLLKHDYALILLDVRMPGMDGFETARIFRKREKTRWVPVIFLTAAMDDASEVARGYASGCVDYLSKPFVPEVLRAKVDVFLELWKKTLLLERQAAELRVANEGLEAFSGSAAHDLRAPLRAIEGFSRILSEDYSGKILDEEGQAYLEKIRRASMRMDALVRDLLAYAHLGFRELAPAPLDLGALVDEVLGSLAGEIRLAGARISVERPLGTASTHAAMLRQAIENLVQNALKFTPAGKTPVVRIRSEPRPGGRRRLWIEDHGIGIPKEDRDRLFRPFSRLDGAVSYAGTGLGLAIVRRAVEKMGGTVGVESESGEGSRFFVELAEASA